MQVYEIFQLHTKSA